MDLRGGATQGRPRDHDCPGACAARRSGGPEARDTRAVPSFRKPREISGPGTAWAAVVMALVLLGGRVAEELVFGEISTGAQNDLQRATEIARSMVTEYGMNERMGLVTYEKERRTLYLPDSMPGAKHYSEEKAAEIDQEVSKSIAETHRRVQEILTGRRETLVTIAKLLLEKEVVQGEELRTLLGPCKSGPSSPSAKTPGRVLAPDQAPA